MPQGCFPSCFWTKSVSVPRASSLLQGLERRKEELRMLRVYFWRQEPVLSSAWCIRQKWRSWVSAAADGLDGKAMEMMVWF